MRRDHGEIGALFNDDFSMRQTISSYRGDNACNTVHTPDAVVLQIRDIEIAMLINRYAHRIYVCLDCGTSVAGEAVAPRTCNGPNNSAPCINPTYPKRAILYDE